MIIKMTLPIVPKAWKRPEQSGKRRYKGAEQKKNERDIEIFMNQHRPREPIADGVRLYIRAYLPVPKSWPINKALDARRGDVRHIVKPDSDNLKKQIMDCLKRTGFYRDDCQVDFNYTNKVYDDGQGPRWEIEFQYED